MNPVQISLLASALVAKRLRIGNSLARALVTGKGNLILVVGWSLDVLRLLGDQSDSALVAFCWDDSDGLSFSLVWLRQQYIPS